MHFVIDLILIAVIIISVIWSAKKGFVRTLVEVVGLVLAIVVAFSLSSPLADVTYDKLVEPPIVKAAGETSAQTVSETTDKAWESIPSFITANGISKDKIENSVEDFTKKNAESVMLQVSQKVIKPVALIVLKAIYSLILMIPLMFLVRLLAKLLNKLFSFSLVGALNRFLGGTIGLIKGVALAMILCKIIILIISFTGNGFWIFTSQNIEETYLFNFLTNVF